MGLGRLYLLELVLFSLSTLLIGYFITLRYNTVPDRLLGKVHSSLAPKHLFYYVSLVVSMVLAPSSVLSLCSVCRMISYYSLAFSDNKICQSSFAATGAKISDLEECFLTVFSHASL